jgi:hypothetical protein
MPAVKSIRIDDYPELALLAWNRAVREVDEDEALALYEANWRFVDTERLTTNERVVPTDLFAEKLLANADRYGDKSVMSRDIIDLMVMQQHWGEIPQTAWEKANAAYGNGVAASYAKALDMLRENPAYLAACLAKMSVDTVTAENLRKNLGP